MRAPKRRRQQPRVFLSPKLGQDDLELIATQVRYVGSPEHKNHPSFAGHPAPRADATKCDPAFKDRQEELCQWLADAIRQGQIGAPLEGAFPRYVWIRQGERIFEARLVNRELGHYKGWELEEHEWPEELS